MKLVKTNVVGMALFAEFSPREVRFQLRSHDPLTRPGTRFTFSTNGPNFRSERLQPPSG